MILSSFDERKSYHHRRFARLFLGQDGSLTERGRAPLRVADFFGRRDLDERPLLARNAPLDDDAVVFDRHDRQALGRHHLVAHVPVHALARVNSTRVRAGADRTVLTVRLGPVRHQTARKPVTLHGALETLTDGLAAHVNLITLLEKLRNIDLRADFVRRFVAKTKFLQVTQRRRARLFAVADFGLGDFVLAHDVVPDLHGVVTIRRRGLHL